MHDVNELGHRVKVSLGYTRNMGNFESLRVDIGLEADGHGNPGPTFDKTYAWAEKRLLEKVDGLEAEIKGVKAQYAD